VLPGNIFLKSDGASSTLPAIPETSATSPISSIVGSRHTGLKKRSRKRLPGGKFTNNTGACSTRKCRDDFPENPRYAAPPVPLLPLARKRSNSSATSTTNSPRSASPSRRQNAATLCARHTRRHGRPVGERGRPNHWRGRWVKNCAAHKQVRPSDQTH